MEPTLVAGQGLVAIRCRRARPGELRIVEHPHRPDFWLVKRVERLTDDGRMWVRSDNPAAEGGDSRQLGAFAVDGSYRVVIRVPRRLMG